MWGSVRVRCRFHVHGCSWTGEQSLVGNHEIKCTFKSWLSRCTYCNKVVPYTDMDKHLQTECEHYSCPKCVQREEMDRASAPSKLKNHSALVVLSKDYRYSINSPLEITQMLVFSYGKCNPIFKSHCVCSIKKRGQKNRRVQGYIFIRNHEESMMGGAGSVGSS